MSARLLDSNFYTEQAEQDDGEDLANTSGSPPFSGGMYAHSGSVDGRLPGARESHEKKRECAC